MLVANFYTKPLQESLFSNFQKMILNLGNDVPGIELCDKSKVKSKKSAIFTKPVTSQEWVEDKIKMSKNIKKVTKSRNQNNDQKSKASKIWYCHVYTHEACMK